MGKAKELGYLPTTLYQIFKGGYSLKSKKMIVHKVRLITEIKKITVQTVT